jgi:hypothetical protein
MIYSAKSRRSKTNSKRTTVPVIVWDYLGLEVGDKIHWALDRNVLGDPVAVISKVEKD